MQELLTNFVESFKGNVFAQIIGLLAMTISFSSYLLKEQKSIAFFQIISLVLFVTHYALLKEASGAIIDGVVLLMIIVFWLKNKYAWAQWKYWIFIFGGLIALSYPMVLFIFKANSETGIVSMDYFWEILPVIGSILYAIGFNSTNGKTVRFFNLIKTPWWFVYNLYAGSLAGLLTELFVAISVVVSMIRYDFRHKPEKSKE